MKARITMTVTKEYELNPKHYPAGSTPEEMVAIDVEDYTEEPDLLFLDTNDDETKVTGEVLA